MSDRQEIVRSIAATAKKLGHVPSRREFQSHAGISEYHVSQHFGGWNSAVSAARLRPYSLNIRAADHVLLKDWGRVGRRLRAVPSRRAYACAGKFSPSTLQNRFGPWSRLPEAFRNFAKGKREWADVLRLLPGRLPRDPVPKAVPDAGRQTARRDRTLQTPPPKIWPASRRRGRPTYGDPTCFPWLRHEPLNEQGVVLLFGMLAKDLGFLIQCVQKGFPDCEALRQVAPGRWQNVRIEFEFESKNFREHGHRADGCDLIVCWRHNWPGHPKHLEILELSPIVKSERFLM